MTVFVSEFQSVVFLNLNRTANARSSEFQFRNFSVLDSSNGVNVVITLCQFQDECHCDFLINHPWERNYYNLGISFTGGCRGVSSGHMT